MSEEKGRFDKPPVTQTHPGSCHVPRVQAARCEECVNVTLKDLHGQDGPGVLQIGDVQVASCVAGQADVQNPERENMEDLG